MECIYLIRHNSTGLHKIGMTTNWDRRKNELRVGSVTTLIRVVECQNARKWERVLHAMFEHERLPQSEWFRIDASDAIPKMEWLSQQTTQPPIIIGNWTQAQDGHWYRRRRSRSGNWYTEQRDNAMMQLSIARELDSRVEQIEKEWKEKARRTKPSTVASSDPAKVLWQAGSPTSSTKGWGAFPLIAGIIGLVVASGVFQAPKNHSEGVRQSEPPKEQRELPRDQPPPESQPSPNLPDPRQQPEVDPPEPKLILPNPCSITSYRDQEQQEFTCSVESRTNNNGHTIYDVSWSDGNKSTYVFWKDGNVEIIVLDSDKKPNVHTGTYTIGGDSVQIRSNEGSVTVIDDISPVLN